jgi:geranylgeranyl reductase family protein
MQLPGTDGQPRVVIVGAGPAGCAAAIALGRAGVDICMLEGGQPGKDKPCGDAVLPPAIDKLRQCGIETQDLLAAGGVSFQQIDLWSRESRFWGLQLGSSGGWMVRRAALDQLLRDRAEHHARIWYGATVTHMIAEQDRSWSVLFRQAGNLGIVPCEAVIIATGSRNQLARRWGIAGEPIETASITTYAGERSLDTPIFQFIGACQPGYGWIFPIGESRVNIGVCALLPDKLRQLRQAAAAYLAEWNVTQAGTWRGGGEPLWSSRGQNWHHPAGIVSCGDAGGLIDPISGEGITAALCSGEQAGRAIVNYLSQGRNLAALGAYSEWVRDFFNQAYQATQVRRVWSSLCGI